MTQQLVALAEAMVLPVLVIDSDERIVAINATARAFLGQEGVGRHYGTLLRQPVLLDAIEACFQDQEPRKSRFFGAQAKREMTWEVIINPMKIEDSLNLVLNFTDITALRDAEQMRRDFVSNVSHELRTPLTALTGFIETLRGAARDDERARDRFLGIMGEEAGRMARLVDDLLSLSRVEEDQRIRPKQQVALTELIEETLRGLQPLIAQSGARIETDLAPNVVMTGDHDQLRQVVVNLVENAHKYGAKGGTIAVRLHEMAADSSLRGAGVRLDVEDQGEGIESFHIARLTERFFRVDTHRSREMGGTGLGLAIVKHIVDRHRGRLRITSTKGVGSTFSVILPVNQSQTTD